MRNLGVLALIIALFVALFKFHGADLTNNVLLLALMVLLAILFPDLKEFDFWGIKGKQKEEEFKKLEGKPSVTPPPTKKKLPATKVEQARQQTILEPEEPTVGHFMTIGFEIERLMRIIGMAVTKPEEVVTPSKAATILAAKGIMTDDGKQQYQAIRDLMQSIMDGRVTELTPELLDTASKVAYDLYLGLKSWLDRQL